MIDLKASSERTREVFERVAVNLERFFAENKDINIDEFLAAIKGMEATYDFAEAQQRREFIDELEELNKLIRK